MLSDLLLERLDNLDEYQSVYDIPKKAFFDLDNTLLVGDIGELIILGMLNEKLNLSMSWDDYLKMLNTEGEGIAYRKIIEAKSGNKIEDIKSLVNKLLSDNNPYIYNEYIKEKPRQNSILKNLLSELKEREYEIYLITAGSHYVAEAVVDKWYPEISYSNIFGVKNKLIDNIMSDELENPIPIREGKGEVVEQILKGRDALITAGDSPNDLEMFNKTHKYGLKLIVDHKTNKTLKVLKNLKSLDNLFFIDWR